MDANGARAFSLAGPADFASAEDPDRVAFRPGTELLVLASQAPAPDLEEDEPTATVRRDAVPPARDSVDGWTLIEVELAHDALVVHLDGVLDQSVFELPHAEGRIDGVAIDPEGIVTVAAAGALWLRDSRTFEDEHEDWRRLDLQVLTGEAAPFEAWRVAPRPDGGAWALSRAQGALATWTGRVLRRAPDREVAPGTFRPDPETPETVGVRAFRELFDGDTPVALAVAPDGQVAVLAWRAGEEARLHLFDPEGAPVRAFALAGLRFPYGLTFVGTDRIATLAVTAAGPVSDALVYPIEHDDPRAHPVGERYPLRRHDGGAFWVSWDGRPTYGTEAGPRNLHALSLPLRATAGHAVATRALDSERADTCWHRLYAEAVLPPGCGLRVLLAASDSPDPPEDPRVWYPHDLGVVPRAQEGSVLALQDGTLAVVVERHVDGVTILPLEDDPSRTVPLDEIAQVQPAPRGTWIPARSELPGHLGLLSCEPTPDRAGLFVVLIQRTGHLSTRLVGRYLHVGLILFGTGRSTPELAALRAWSPRFSYVREYLPELYHEHPQVDGSDERGPATAPDFLERFVGLFEGLLTPLEDKVAEAWQWTNPTTTPELALDWLASWVGLTLDPALPVTARRELIRLAPTLARWRGTLQGLQLLLEVVTEGGVSRGDVIVLEEWRLRRTWATVLGADLTDDADPLLLGLSVDTNSIVGDTLILGDEYHQEFLALYGPSQPVGDFFEASAHRISVLVHEALPEATRQLVEKAVQDGIPAHVYSTIRTSSRHFIVGVQALVGVDTKLGVEPPPAPVRLGHSRLGAGDRLTRPGTLHPDVEGGEA
jgi:phage tail-like protein